MHSILLVRSFRKFFLKVLVVGRLLTADYRCKPTDVTSKKDLEALVEEISKKEKHIDLLCMKNMIEAHLGLY